jgi:polyisoprenoid-binding protein YceI
MITYLTTHRRLLLVAALAVLAGMAVGTYGLWYMFLRPAGPAAVGGTTLAIPSASVGTPAASAGDGNWQVDTSIGSFTDFSGSFVGYRVQEELVGIGGNTAVGRTPDVTGSLTTDGRTLTAATIAADLTTLVSDDDRRDNQLRKQALETNQFPTATFELTEPVVIPDTAVEGDTVEVTAVGELTLHGVTQPVEVPLQVRYESGVIAVAGSIEIVFADYEMETPSSFLVLSVDNHGVMELQLFFTQA